MGNCQAVDASALEIQLPDGKTERLYSQVTVSEVMRINPGHYVALIMPLSLSLPVPRGHNQEQVLKLLRPDETLTLGHTYRLITTQGEVVKVLKPRKRARTRKPQAKALLESMQITHLEEEGMRGDSQKLPVNSAALRPKSWRPSLQSISESGSSVGMRGDRQKLPVNSAALRPKSWRPYLQSISESGSSVLLACD